MNIVGQKQEMIKSEKVIKLLLGQTSLNFTVTLQIFAVKPIKN